MTTVLLVTDGAAEISIRKRLFIMAANPNSIQNKEKRYITHTLWTDE